MKELKFVFAVCAASLTGVLLLALMLTLERTNKLVDRIQALPLAVTVTNYVNETNYFTQVDLVITDMLSAAECGIVHTNSPVAPDDYPANFGIMNLEVHAIYYNGALTSGPANALDDTASSDHSK